MHSHKMIFAAIAFTAALLIGNAAFAATATTTATTTASTAPTGAPPAGMPPMGGPQGGPMGGPPPGGGNPAAHAAHDACMGTVAKDAQGHPDHAAMEACMKAKGFTPPEHGAGGPPPGGPPPMGAGGSPSNGPPVQMAAPLTKQSTK